MSATRYLKNSRIRIWCATGLFFCLFGLTACGGGSGGGGGNSGDNPPDTPQEPTYEWEQHLVKDLSGSGGKLTNNVRAVTDTNGDIHIAYFSDGEEVEGDLRYMINHEILDGDDLSPLSQTVLDPMPPQSGGEGVDSCQPLALAVDGNGVPAILYDGGNPRSQSSDGSNQDDLMVSLREGGVWQEAFAAVGYVARQIPSQRDGLVTADDWLVFDSNGDLHICFQYHYEGMDEVPPDLFYVKWERNDLPYVQGYDMTIEDWADIEEQIYGNEYPNNSSFGIHRDVGYSCKMLLDENDNPIIFFVEQPEADENRYILHMARRSSTGDWEQEEVDSYSFSSNFSIGRISAAIAPDGTLSVAYQVKCENPSLPNDGDYLKFASKIGDKWNIQKVDDHSNCGDYCFLAYDANGNPAIAYYDKSSRQGNIRNNLKIAWFDGTSWESETVSKIDDIGIYNSLWFDGNNMPVICTFSESENKIFIFRLKESEG